ncbi:MAG: transketolase [Candidatus Eremiobacterota bacterium]
MIDEKSRAKLDELTRKSVDTLRFLAIDGIQAANSGHPGLPMGMADVAYIIWTKYLKHNPGNPKWPDRDRFVLSAGHGSMLLYSLLHLTGYDLTLEDLKKFRQWGSKTPGHPESHLTGGVETTTGPLGQGFCNGIGMAIAKRFLASRFNRPGYPVVDYKIYAIVSDGDLMEGVTHEAASLAGHLGLNELIYIYDDNGITIDGSTDLAFTEDRGKRFEAYGWFVQHINGHDHEEIINAINKAREEQERPSIIMAKTIIGYGSPNRSGKSKVHGEPLGAEEIALTRKALQWPEAKFYIPDDVLSHYRKAVTKGIEAEKNWQHMMEKYGTEYSEQSAQFKEWMSGPLPSGWNEDLPEFKEGTSLATRASSGKVLNVIAKKVGNILGGSADLHPSNNTYLEGFTPLKKGDFSGRNMHFGIREHGMGSIMNGMALNGGIIPYGGTFLVFSDYMKGSIRLAAIMGIQVIYVFTHDSIGLGEDGPTHQAVEHIASLRAIPGLTVIRPADGNETVQAWISAIENTGGPTALILTRQAVPSLDQSKFNSARGLHRGAYIVTGSEKPEIILIGTGSEIHIALEAYNKLLEEGIGARVVSMPSWELFDKEPEEYKKEILPESVPKVAIEAGVRQGWDKYIGTNGEVISIDRFGASAPYKIIYQEYGLTCEAMVKVAKKILCK